VNTHGHHRAGTSTDRDNPKAELGQAVAVQLAVQRWATTRGPGSAGLPDDPFDPAA
jgi:hypothetical protein